MNKVIKKVFIGIVCVLIFVKQYNFGVEKMDIFDSIDAPEVLVAETNSLDIIFERNIDKKIYPASLTKLLTAILVVENTSLEDIVTVSENAVLSVPVGYVNACLQVGEELTVKDLLNVLLISSANDAANALAEHVGGSIDSFSAMMNTKAKELGCTSSNFTNPSGLHQLTHYTTVRDLMLISRAAIQNNIVKNILGTIMYKLPISNKYNEENRIFYTTNYMIRQSYSNFYCDYIIGGKTGYTDQAQNCVVEFVEKDGISLIVIVIGESSAIKGKKFLDCKELCEYIFKNYKNYNVINKEDIFDTIEIKKATNSTKKLQVKTDKDINILMIKDDDIKDVKVNINYFEKKSPIKEGETIGKVIYEYNEKQYEANLIAVNNVEETENLKKFFRIILIFALLYIIQNLKKSKRNIGKHGKNKKHKKYKKARRR